MQQVGAILSALKAFGQRRFSTGWARTNVQCAFEDSANILTACDDQRVEGEV